jgi:hypothetical protein
LLNPRPTHPPSDFFFLTFFLVSFWAFLGKGSQKDHGHIFAKSPWKTFPKITDKNFDVSFSSIWFSDFCFIAFSGVSQLLAMDAKKNTTKNVFTKNRQKIPNRFFSVFVYHVFGRFSVRGVQKHDKKIPNKLIWPWSFLGL